MKKWFKECPFCKNEIKKDAIKCMYCKEMLYEESLIEPCHDSKGIIDSNNVKQGNSGILSNSKLKSILLGVGVGIIIFVVIVIFFKNVGKSVDILDNSVLDENLKSDYDNVVELRKSINTYYDSIINNDGKPNSNEFSDYLDSTKNVFSDSKYQDLLDEMNNTVSTYINDVSSIGDFYINDVYELKDLSKLNEIISNRYEYKSLSNKYIVDISRIIDDTVSSLGKSGSDVDYSIKYVLDNISKLVYGIDEWADINIEFFSYVSTIQNDFYIYDGAILFYEQGYSMNKFFDLWVEWEKQSEVFEEVYTNYNNFMVDYAKQAKMK